MIVGIGREVKERGRERGGEREREGGEKEGGERKRGGGGERGTNRKRGGKIKGGGREGVKGRYCAQFLIHIVLY